jgi:hypothetical protein
LAFAGDARRLRGWLSLAEVLSEFIGLASRSIARLHNRDWCGGRWSSKEVVKSYRNLIYINS